MKITLKNKGNVYEQIVNEYKRYIELGIIKTDEKLPSCRTLGKELGINPNTVAKAFKVLEDEGYISSIEKKGSFVVYKKDTENEKEEIKQYIKKNIEKISYDELIKMIDEIYREVK